MASRARRQVHHGRSDFRDEFFSRCFQLGCAGGQCFALAFAAIGNVLPECVGQRRFATHTRCDFSHSNPPYPLAQLITHISSADCMCVTVPLDSHTWTERTECTRLPGAALAAHRIFILARSRVQKVATASFRVIYATSVWLYIHLRILCVTRAARVSVMVRRHQTAIGITNMPI